MGTKNEEILSLIIGYIQKYGYPPTVREIGAMAGITSTNTVYYHLKQMKEAGMIETDDGAGARAMRIPGYTFAKTNRGEENNNG